MIPIFELWDELAANINSAWEQEIIVSKLDCTTETLDCTGTHIEI